MPHSNIPTLKHYCTFDYKPFLGKQGEELFIEHGVDLVMSGHIHSYERTLPMERGVATSSDYAGPGLSPVYIVQGSSGNRENNPGFPTVSYKLFFCFWYLF
jgi:hypothetical protein